MGMRNSECAGLAVDKELQLRTVRGTAGESRGRLEESVDHGFSRDCAHQLYTRHLWHHGLRRFLAAHLVSCASSIADFSISIMDGVTEDVIGVSCTIIMSKRKRPMHNWRN
jgi:hypothetical protein